RSDRDASGGPLGGGAARAGGGSATRTPISAAVKVRVTVGPTIIAMIRVCCTRDSDFRAGLCAVPELESEELAARRAQRRSNRDFLHPDLVLVVNPDAELGGLGDVSRFAPGLGQGFQPVFFAGVLDHLPADGVHRDRI